jgi:hypothetical protein
MNLVENEQTKLTATYFNGLSVALFGVGTLAPVLSYAFGQHGPQPFWLVLAASMICFAISGAIHLYARYHLKGLVE